MNEQQAYDCDNDADFGDDYENNINDDNDINDDDVYWPRGQQKRAQGWGNRKQLRPEKIALL